jgi:hypothetical protein
MKSPELLFITTLEMPTAVSLVSNYLKTISVALQFVMMMMMILSSWIKTRPSAVAEYVSAQINSTFIKKNILFTNKTRILQLFDEYKILAIG